jgi:3-oxoadipate enol-lactonase
VPYADVNGAQLWYEERGSGDAVVFLHAGLLDSRQWARQLETFSPRYRAVAFDARGYGRSAQPTEPFSRHQDVLGLLDAGALARAREGGHNLGG